MHLVAPLDKHFPLLYVLLKDHIADDVDYKVCFPIYTYINFFFWHFCFWSYNMVNNSDNNFLLLYL